MRHQIKRNRQGRPYISISGYDPVLGKNRTWKKSEVPSWVNSSEKAEEFIKTLQAQFKSAKYRIEQKLKYKNQFFEFQGLTDLYTTEMQKKSKVDWQNSVRDLEHFVFDFFLNTKQANNINDWPIHYSDFKDWLENVATPVKGKARRISYSQMNSAISALNTFIEVLKNKQKINFSTPKCPRFSQSLIKRRNEDDVLSNAEKQDLITTLQKIDKDVADFASIAIHVGARVGELLGLSLENYLEGTPNDKTIANILTQHNLSCYGYFTFNSQLENPSKPRNANGKVARKPLKHRKNMSASDYRCVPILDPDIHNLIADKYDKCLIDLNNKVYGSDTKDYLLFKDLKESQISKALKSAYTILKKYKPKTSHCFRHTFATDLAGKVSIDHRLFELTLGHKDYKTTQSYNHMNQIISRSLSTQKTISLGGIKKVVKKEI